MVKHNRKAKKKSTYILWGIGVSLLLAVISAILITSLIMSGKIDENSNVYVYPVLGICSAIGTIIVTFNIKEKIAVNIGICVGIYAFLLMTIAVVFYEGIGKNFLYGLVSILGGAIISCAICIRKSGSRRRRKKATV